MGLWWQLCGNPFSLPSVFLSRAAGLTVRGREEKKKKREADAAPQNTLQPRMRSFFQDAHAALTLTLQRVDERRPLRPSGFKTSHTLVHQAAGLYNFWSASSDIRLTPSVGSGQPRRPRCVCFVFLRCTTEVLMCLHLIWVMRAIRFAARLVIAGVGRTVLDRMTWRNRRLQMGTLESEETKWRTEEICFF